MFWKIELITYGGVEGRYLSASNIFSFKNVPNQLSTKNKILRVYLSFKVQGKKKIKIVRIEGTWIVMVLDL